jgi:hypothetical protein
MDAYEVRLLNPYTGFLNKHPYHGCVLNQSERAGELRRHRANCPILKRELRSGRDTFSYRKYIAFGQTIAIMIASARNSGYVVTDKCSCNR